MLCQDCLQVEVPKTRNRKYCDDCKLLRKRRNCVRSIQKRYESDMEFRLRKLEYNAGRDRKRAKK